MFYLTCDVRGTELVISEVKATNDTSNSPKNGRWDGQQQTPGESVVPPP